MITHYGFLPVENVLNNPSILTQELVKFLAYFTLLSILLNDISRTTKSKFLRLCYVVIILLNLVILGFIIQQYIDMDDRF